MGEIVEAHDQGRLIEAFGCGTAAVVSPVQSINFLNKVTFTFILKSMTAIY